MAGRAAASAMDEAAIFWLHNDEPFALNDMGEWMMGMAASAVRETIRLDPESRIEDAPADFNARSPRWPRHAN